MWAFEVLTSLSNFFTHDLFVIKIHTCFSYNFNSVPLNIYPIDKAKWNGYESLT